MYTFFKIDPLTLCVFTTKNLLWTENLKIFQSRNISENTASLKLTINFVKTFPQLWGKVLYRDNTMLIMLINEKEHRIHLLPKTGEPYALTQHIDEHNIQLWIDERIKPHLRWDRNLVGLFSLEHFCLSYHSFLLHASYIIHQGKAILFTAPSGTGKSTQADLWAKYENAKIINGDRALLINKNGCWYAGGFPICGSSDFCLNEVAPVQAIIYLAQGTEDQIAPLSPIQALIKIYSQSFINTWNPHDCKKVTSLIADLTNKIPVYYYKCTKEKNAVDMLKKILK